MVPFLQRPLRAGTQPTPPSLTHWDRKEHSLSPLPGSHLKVTLRSQTQGSQRLVKSDSDGHRAIKTILAVSPPWLSFPLQVDLNGKITRWCQTSQIEHRLCHWISCLTFLSGLHSLHLCIIICETDNNNTQFMILLWRLEKFLWEQRETSLSW